MGFETLGFAGLMKLILPAAVGAAGDAINTAIQPEPQRVQSFGRGEVESALREAQEAARRFLAFGEARQGQQPFFPEFDVQGLVGDVNVPGLAPGLLGIRQGTADLINTPLGGPPIAPAPGSDPGVPGATPVPAVDPFLQKQQNADNRFASSQGEIGDTAEDPDDALGDPDSPFASKNERKQAMADIQALIKSLQQGVSLDNAPPQRVN